MTFKAQAEQKQKGGIMSLFSGGAKYDEAADLYLKAANQFKLIKDWQNAADSFASFGACSAKAGMPTDEANGYVEAARCLKNISANEALFWFDKASGILSAAGRFTQAAKILKEVAEIHESEANTKKAAEFYQKAEDMFSMDEHSKSQVTACILKRAELMAENGEILEAAQLFEKEGEKALLNPMLQFGAREHFLKAGILYLALGDPVTAKVACERFHQRDPRLEGTREGKLLKGLTAAFSENDLDGFREKLAEYDQVTRLDEWKAKHLLSVVGKMESPEGAEAEVDFS